MENNETELNDNCNGYENNDDKKIDIKKKGTLIEKLQYFSNNLINKIDKIDDECEKQKDLLNDTLNECINCLKLQKDKFEDDLCKFYDNKRLSLINALEDTKRIEEFNNNLNNPIIKRNLNKMADELIYITENLMNKVTLFKRNIDHINGIGELNTPPYELPIKEHIILLKTTPKKIVHTRKGFLSWHDHNKIIELMFGRTIISEKEDILDICSTFDHRLSYIVHVNSNFYCKTLNLENDEWIMKSFSYQYDDLSDIKFGVFRKNIIITSGNGKIRYIPRTDAKASDKEKESTTKFSFNHKCFNEGLCLDYKDFAEYLLDNGEHIKFCINDQITSSYSLYENIINELLKGRKMYSDNDKLIIIDIDSKTGYSLQHEKIFPGKRLMDYHMDNNQIVFCLLDIENPKMITLQYYPTFQDDNFYKNE